jgi:branched-chain amino acid transport system ATP-binding protein
MPLLSIEKMCVTYGPVKAVRDFTFSVDAGELVTILGANGSGKTSTLNAIMGMAPITEGRVVFNGEEITSQPTEKIVKKGMTLVPEGRRVFPKLTVYENLDLGTSGLNKPGSASERNRKLEEIFDLFPILSERLTQQAGTLSGGEQQQLAIARALMCDPKLLLMDEPSLGLAPIIIDKIFNLIAKLHASGVTILLVEQNVRQAIKIADRGYVLTTGTLRLSGTSQELLSSTSVERAYLGVREHERKSQPWN